MSKFAHRIISENRDTHNQIIMNLATLAHRNNPDSRRIAYNAAMYLTIEPHHNKERLVCRPHAKFVHNEEFMDIFAHLGQTTETYNNPACLRCLEYGNDEQGPYWLMSSGKYLSLAQLVNSKANVRLDEKWVDRSIEELLDITVYLNRKGQQLLEFTPHSILVTKDSQNHIAVMPPLSDFLPLRKLLYAKVDERIAPELFNNDEVGQRADIYGIGRMVEFLHPYPTLPYKYREIISQAVQEQASMRPQSTVEMQEIILKRAQKSRITSIAISIASVVAFLAFVVFFPWTDDNQPYVNNLVGPDTTLFDDGVLMDGYNDYDPLVNKVFASTTDAEKSRMLDQYMHDSTYMSMDTAVSLSPEMKEYQRKMMVLASKKFRSQFKQQARAILKKVYTEENMQSQEDFMAASQAANAQLMDMKAALTNQYQIDVTTGTRIAGEVYDEVVNELKKKLK